MVDYNDGEWHDWYGGKCPVNAETEVLYQLAACSRREVECDKDMYTDPAGFLDWVSTGHDWSIVAFRVSEKYVKNDQEEPLTSSISALSQNIKDSVIVLNDAIAKANKAGVVTEMQILEASDWPNEIIPYVDYRVSLRL